MSSRSLNEILIKIPTELFNFIFAAYNLRFILPRVVCLQLYAKGDARRIQQRCFIYRSIFVIPALRKRRVQGHCEAYHFRIRNNKTFTLSNLNITHVMMKQYIHNGISVTVMFFSDQVSRMAVYWYLT